mmetsp:Transcript_31811/g.84947  ORF Transcript_31811/g.84947 Transcript_31811/m.84947 type:complete len:210 (-) Transcript_31811:980-1609(-)
MAPSSRTSIDGCFVEEKCLIIISSIGMLPSTVRFCACAGNAVTGRRLSHSKRYSKRHSPRTRIRINTVPSSVVISICNPGSICCFAWPSSSVPAFNTRCSQAFQSEASGTDPDKISIARKAAARCLSPFGPAGWLSGDNTHSRRPLQSPDTSPRRKKSTAQGATTGAKSFPRSPFRTLCLNARSKPCNARSRGLVLERDGHFQAKGGAD